MKIPALAAVLVWASALGLGAFPATGHAAEDIYPPEIPGYIYDIYDSAVAGDPDAQNDIARLYDNGTAVPRNHEKAFEWAKKAAEQGHAGAQFTLGRLYENGAGAGKDPATALRWYSAAAEQGIAEAAVARDHLMRKGYVAPSKPVSATPAPEEEKAPEKTGQE